MTVTATPTVKFAQFHQICQKLFYRNIFVSGYYIYEQDGDTPETMGQGFRAHFVMERNLNYKPYKTKINAFNSVKKVCSAQAFGFKHIGEDFRKDKLEYIFGLKNGEGRDAKQKMDILFREAMQVEIFYERKPE